MSVYKPNQGWLPREGFTADVVQNIVQKTILNPGLTLPLWLLTRYTHQGQGFALDHPTAVNRLKLALYFGIARYLNGVLNRGALNNWTSDKYDWDRELIVITGGSEGFGKLLVHMFAQKNRNTRIVILDKVAPAYSMPSPYIHYVPVDLSIPEEIKDACERVKKEYGDPTVVFLNAGIAIPYTISNIPDKTLDKVFAVNTLSHYRVVREFLPSICARNHGMIITTASLAGYVVPPGMVDYCASKSAAIAFHEGLTAELKHRYNAPKVRTICVCPNFARTKLADGFVNKSNFLSPTLYPETVAEAIFAQVLSGNSGFVTIPKTHSWFAQTVRAWPWWMQKGVSDGLKEVMRTVEGTRKDA